MRIAQNCTFCERLHSALVAMSTRRVGDQAPRRSEHDPRRQRHERALSHAGEEGCWRETDASARRI
jgi:hypothetical protein